MVIQKQAKGGSYIFMGFVSSIPAEFDPVTSKSIDCCVAVQCNQMPFPSWIPPKQTQVWIYSCQNLQYQSKVWTNLPTHLNEKVCGNLTCTLCFLMPVELLVVRVRACFSMCYLSLIQTCRNTQSRKWYKLDIGNTILSEKKCLVKNNEPCGLSLHQL